MGSVRAPRSFNVNSQSYRTIVLASAFTIFLSTGIAVAQDGAKQDMKAAGTDTKNAAKNTGHAVSTGTKKAYNKTANGTRAHKTANAPKRLPQD